MLAALHDIEGGSHSLAELRVGPACRRAGLQEPDRQTVRRDKQNRRRYLDCEWRCPDGRIVVLEVDGAQHMEAAHWAADMPRERAVVVSGRTVLRCSALELRVTPTLVTDDLAAAGVLRSLSADSSHRRRRTRGNG